jgi:hypothetical protein
MAPADWIARYARACETDDDDTVADLFTADAVDRSQIFGEPHVGTAQIRAYWRPGAGTQSDVAVRFGRPVAEGRRVAVEWWGTPADPDEGEITLPGCLLLRFDDHGRCEQLREYGHVEPRLHELPEGWGE